MPELLPVLTSHHVPAVAHATGCAVLPVQYDPTGQSMPTRAHRRPPHTQTGTCAPARAFRTRGGGGCSGAVTPRAEPARNRYCIAPRANVARRTVHACRVSGPRGAVFALRGSASHGGGGRASAVRAGDAGDAGRGCSAKRAVSARRASASCAMHEHAGSVNQQGSPWAWNCVRMRARMCNGGYLCV